ncbi:hypothetical protein [uncultured Aureimonas sp.]|uniref:hypothetical protein n=1 Tax=uncultured Aureimonas sp. TaxID=1604662 RepID=UPI0025D45850|nr:hypothetical protein [uncultured Aureimonas sp.]
MSRRAIFAYERGLRGPSPVVFYDDVPNVNGKPTPLLARHEIEGGTGNAEFFPGADETPSLTRLATAFPPPSGETA